MQQRWRYWNFVTLPSSLFPLYQWKSRPFGCYSRHLYNNSQIVEVLLHGRKNVYVSGGKNCLFFWKIRRALFSWNTRFEICPFALLPTISSNANILNATKDFFFFEIKGFCERLLWSKNQWNHNFLEFSLV